MTLTIATAAEVIKVAPTRQKIELKTIEDSIFIAENNYIRPFLGDAFYYEILQQKATNTLTTTNMSFWYYFLQKYIAYATVMEALPFMQYQISTNGVTVADGSNTRNAELDEYKLLAANLAKQIQVVEKACHDYLVGNAANCPLFPANAAVATCCKPQESEKKLMIGLFFDEEESCEPPFQFTPPPIVEPVIETLTLFSCANGATPELKKIVRGEVILSDTPLQFATATDAANYISATYNATAVSVTIGIGEYIKVIDNTKWNLIICCCVHGTVVNPTIMQKISLIEEAIIATEHNFNELEKKGYMAPE